MSLYLHGQRLQDTSQYVLSELQALETEQKHIDNRAGVVERRLRRLMESGENDERYQKGAEPKVNRVRHTVMCAYQRINFLSIYSNNNKNAPF